MARGGKRPGAGRPKTGAQVGAVESAAPTVDDGSLLSKYRRLAEATEKTIDAARENPGAFLKDITSAASTLNRTYWHIAKLTGEAELTEAKIVKSDAWRRMFAEVVAVLSKHPEAAVALKKHFESFEK